MEQTTTTTTDGGANANPTTTAAPAAATPAPTWIDSFDPDTKGYVETKGFKDPKAVVESYRNMEKLLGAPREKIVRWPDNVDEPNALDDVYKRLGRPDSKEGYGLVVDKDGTNKALVEALQNTFHANGVSKKQADAFVNTMAKLEADGKAAAQAKMEAEGKAAEEGLKREWGAAFEQKANSAKRAAREFGLSGEVIDKIEASVGYTELMKLLDNVGSKLGEGSFHNPGGGNQTLIHTPAAALNRIQALKQDQSFIQRMDSQDAAALAEWTRLHKEAYPENV
jgi:hypothetical protein